MARRNLSRSLFRLIRCISMTQLNESAAPPPLLESSARLRVAPAPTEPGLESARALASPEPVVKMSAAHLIFIVLGAMVFLYLARPVVLPVFLASVAGMTLKPLIRWLSGYRVPPAFSAAVVLVLLISTSGIGFFYLGQPAMRWMNEAPQHMTELRQRTQKLFPRLERFSQAAAAVNNLGATKDERKEEQKNAPTVEVRDARGASVILNWTGTLLVGIAETLVLIYLLLASGDLFMQKLVHIMPTLSDKKRAVEMSHEVQRNISNYLFSVSLINVGLGVFAGTGLYLIGVPNAAMWGMILTLFNYVPYFGPVLGMLLLGMVGLISFDTVWLSVLPFSWYLLLHLVEANLVTPMVLGRRFTLNPVVIFISLIFWTWLWGVPGALLSVPILVSIKAIAERVPALAHVNEFLTS